MRRLGVILAGLAVLAAAGCGGGSSSDDNYPEAVRANFTSSCMANGGSTSQCGCALEYLEARLSYGNFAVAETTGVYPKEVASAIDECIA